MGLNTTTFNTDELITAYADNQISDPVTKQQVEELLRKDQKLLAKYKSELLTKQLLKSRMPQADLPRETYMKVMSSVDDAISASKKKYADTYSTSRAGISNPAVNSSAVIEYPSFWQSLKETFTGKFIGVPRYAFAILAFFIIGGLVYFSGGKKTRNPYILSGTESSIMVQAVNSFHKVLNGEVKPQLKSSNAAEVEKFVMEKAHFDPYVPQIDNYSISGVVCNDYHGQELAHLIYQDNDGNLIYIFQVPITAVQKKNLDLPEDVQKEINLAKYYMCDEVDENDCTMTLWYKENNVCASMSNMPKKEMFTTFTSFNK